MLYKRFWCFHSAQLFGQGLHNDYMCLVLGFPSQSRLTSPFRSTKWECICCFLPRRLKRFPLCCRSSIGRGLEGIGRGSSQLFIYCDLAVVQVASRLPLFAENWVHGEAVHMGFVIDTTPLRMCWFV